MKNKRQRLTVEADGLRAGGVSEAVGGSYDWGKEVGRAIVGACKSAYATVCSWFS